MKTILIRMIECYQKTLSPDTGWFKRSDVYCKFTPSCSHYCKESIEKHGLIKGIGRGVWRILRCNPWNRGGYDPA